MIIQGGKECHKNLFLFAKMAEKLADTNKAILNPFALRMAKTQWSVGCSECNRVKHSPEGKGKCWLNLPYLFGYKMGGYLSKITPDM